MVNKSLESKVELISDVVVEIYRDVANDFLQNSTMLSNI